MATVIAVGNINIEADEAPSFIEKIGKAVTDGLGLDPSLKSIHYQYIDPAYTTPKAKPEITFFVYTAPDKTTPQKRQLIANIGAAVDDFFGEGEVISVVIVKIHDNNNVGVNGVLRADAYAIREQEAAQAAARA